MNNNCTTNLVYIEKFNKNELQLIINSIISKFRKYIDNFVTKGTTDYFIIKDILIY